MPHQRTRKKKKRRERSQDSTQEEQQRFAEEETGLQGQKESPHRIKARKKRRKTSTERFFKKASKHDKAILVAILLFILALFIVYRFTF